MLLKLNLDITATLGVYAHEKHPRAFPLALTIRFNPGAAVVSDRLEDALDYDGIARVAREVAGARAYNLIEALVTAIGQALIVLPQVEEAQVEIQKPGALEGGGSAAISGVFRR